jgi:hypothetical protein
MALRWYHPFVSTKTDGIDSTLVKPSNWNADHTASTDTVTGVVVGRDNQGSGALQELPASWDPTQKLWSFLEAVGGLFPGSGTTSQRPTTPQVGTIRYNTTTNGLEVFSRGVWTRVSNGSSFGAILSGDLTIGPGSSVNWQGYSKFYEYDTSFNASNGIWSPQIAGAYSVSAFSNMAVDGGGAMRLILYKVSPIQQALMQADTYHPSGVSSASVSNVLSVQVGDAYLVQVVNLSSTSGARCFGASNSGFSAAFIGS